MVDPTGTYDLSDSDNQGTVYTFTATAFGTDAVAKDITVEVSFDGTNWVAEVK